MKNRICLKNDHFNKDWSALPYLSHNETTRRIKSHHHTHEALFGSKMNITALNNQTSYWKSPLLIIHFRQWDQITSILKWRQSTNNWCNIYKEKYMLNVSLIKILISITVWNNEIIRLFLNVCKDFVKKCLRTSVVFVATDTLLWASGDFCLGLQNQDARPPPFVCFVIWVQWILQIHL